MNGYDEGIEHEWLIIFSAFVINCMFMPCYIFWIMPHARRPPLSASPESLP